MTMQYGDPLLDQLVEDHFRPAVAQTGIDLRRLDDEQPAGLIDDRLRVEIQSARFLIVDLTHSNRGAYWEAGYARTAIASQGMIVDRFKISPATRYVE